MDMNRQQNPSAVSDTKPRGETDVCGVSGWTTETELVRGFDRPVMVADAVGVTIHEAIQEWSELSETPPLYQSVDAENLDGLFRPQATGDSGWLPSVNFQHQSCRVTVLYGSSVRVIVERDP